ncbi:hypothetical protein F5148DRAFT_1191211 [Russula earlei]|uniref:Uncharacterized protein n=1 Tax=Russula earlei TaxID=71964 RepID=A0ACC0UCY9_9AGAM|nr:hypothetical protein F5148DRAFT_1191211 [Russula earlei]
MPQFFEVGIKSRLHDSQSEALRSTAAPHRYIYVLYALVAFLSGHSSLATILISERLSTHKRTAVDCPLSDQHTNASREYHPYSNDHLSTPRTPLSPTLVDFAQHTERSFIKFRIPSGSSNIVNSEVVDRAGQALYSISSTSKRTTLVAAGDNAKVATVEWDRSSPRMVFRRKKMRCKEWLPLAGPETQSRILTHGDVQFAWMDQLTSGYLIPANRPGLAVARWRIKSRTDILILEILQEALVEPGLLEAIVLSLVLLRSGRSLGDTIDRMNFGSDPRFFSQQYTFKYH